MTTKTIMIMVIILVWFGSSLSIITPQAIEKRKYISNDYIPYKSLKIFLLKFWYGNHIILLLKGCLGKANCKIQHSSL